MCYYAKWISWCPDCEMRWAREGLQQVDACPSGTPCPMKYVKEVLLADGEICNRCKKREEAEMKAEASGECTEDGQETDSDHEHEMKDEDEDTEMEDEGEGEAQPIDMMEEDSEDEGDWIPVEDIEEWYAAY